MKFKRFRKNRINENIRKQNRETSLERSDFIWPVFIVDGKNIKTEIKAMPDTFQFSIDVLLDELKVLTKKGLEAILIFGVPETKSIEEAYSSTGLVQQTVLAVKENFPNLRVITDVCLCSYTEDGHCHIGDNDKTCEILAKIALSHATAGADAVAPSDMMDGRVLYIKDLLVKNNLNDVEIISYSAKFASNFYGPFRDAADCSPKSGNRKTYQMDFANSNEAMLEIEADIEEGTNSIIIKPALSYLDIISRSKEKYNLETIAYNVSGEYSMLKNAVLNGIVSESIIDETLISMKRAGADKIISYFTPYFLNKDGDIYEY